MIYDSAKNLDFYRSLGIGDRYAKAIDFLKNTDLAALLPGKYEIDGKDVYANVMTYETIPWEDAKYESHDNYTDIQYIIEGSEAMSYAPRAELTVKTPYNPEKDVTFYTNDVRGTEMVAEGGWYMIFMPWDGHKPKAMNGKPGTVKKVVVKIREI